MTAAAQGPRAASLNVVSDDPDTPALAIPLHGTGGTPGPSPSASATVSSTPSPSPSASSSKPQALPGGPPNDTLAIWLVVAGVTAGFGGLIVVRRRRTAGEERW
jgi:hypothetical protein